MGQKVNPIGFRVGITEPWSSRWYARRNYGTWLLEDNRIRGFVRREYGFAGISRVDIQRIGDRIQVKLLVARPGLIIGKRGAKVDELGKDLVHLVGKTVDVDVQEIENPEIDAQIVAEAIGEQLKKRAPYRRMMRKYAEAVMGAGVKGVKIQCKGRLGGAEIAREEKITKGSVPLHTLRAEIHYGQATAILSKGTIGIKVWIYRGDRFREKDHHAAAPAAPADKKA